jgi:hypothetical protein
VTALATALVVTVSERGFRGSQRASTAAIEAVHAVHKGGLVGPFQVETAPSPPLEAQPSSPVRET